LGGGGFLFLFMIIWLIVCGSCACDANSVWVCTREAVTRVNSTNVQDEGLRIGGIGRRMNLKVKVSQTRRVLRVNVAVNLA
jgi:hypothetical protein